uniref:Uncharacterized protein n=1 Tax=Oryza brachyantha TaxID=4533 RepID=J3KX64_ORYBR
MYTRVIMTVLTSCLISTYVAWKSVIRRVVKLICGALWRCNFGCILLCRHVSN